MEIFSPNFSVLRVPLKKSNVTPSPRELQRVWMAWAEDMRIYACELTMSRRIPTDITHEKCLNVEIFGNWTCRIKCR